MKHINLKITTRTQFLKWDRTNYKSNDNTVVLATKYTSRKVEKKERICNHNTWTKINKSVHHDHLTVILWQTVKRQLRDRQTVERQDREWDNELSYITQRTHRRHSWTYLSSREAKRKKTIAKPSLNLRKWIYFCFCLILLTKLIFYFIAIW